MLGVRADGYHLLDSLIAFAELGDRVAVSPADDLSLTADGPFAGALPAGTDNLVLRAAHGLRESCGVSAGAAIRLTKILPVASGIGGGSADAAAALRALMALWRVDPPAETLAALALSLGADVPVCLNDRPAFVGGIGERIEAAPALPPADLVLVNPGVPVATADVFRGRRGAFSQSARFAAPPDGLDGLVALLADRRNDLSESAECCAPENAAALAALDAQPGCRLARMSGSGATCFGLFEDGDVARRAAGAIEAIRPGWWVRATRLADGAAEAG